MSVKKRLADVIKSLNLKRYQFAESIGVSQPTVSDWLNKANVNPSIDSLTKIADIHGVNLNWLLTGAGSMYQDLQPIDAAFLGDTISIPIVGEIAAGHPAEEIYEQPYPTLDIPVSLLFYPPPYIVFKVSGQSMAPLVLPGDLVICSQDWRGLDVNGMIMAFRTPDGITLKKLIEDYKHKTTLLVPLNSGYEPTIYTEGDPDILLIGILDLCIRGYNRM